MKTRFYLIIAVLFFWIPLQGQWVKADDKTFHDMLPTNRWMRLIDYCKNDQIEQLLHTGLFGPEISENEILQLSAIINALYSNHDKLLHLLIRPKETGLSIYNFHFYISKDSFTPQKERSYDITVLKKIGFEFDEISRFQIVKIIFYDLTKQELNTIQEEINKNPPPSILPPPYPPMNTFDKANLAYQERDYDKAKYLYEIIINIGLEDYLFDAYLGRANCNYSQNNFEAAKLDIQKALKVTPDFIEFEKIMINSYWLYASIYSKENNIEKSLEHLKNASQFMESSKLYSSIAYDEINLQKYEDAMLSLNKAFEINENEPFAYSNRSLLYLKTGKLGEARLDITKSIELYNINPYAYKHSAMIYIAEGNIEEACKELNKAAQLVMPKNIHGSNHEEIQSLLNKHCN